MSLLLGDTVIAQTVRACPTGAQDGSAAVRWVWARGPISACRGGQKVTHERGVSHDREVRHASV